jgi:hypothetical protein
MSVILSRLSIFNLLLLAVTFTVGLVSWHRQALQSGTDPTYLVHFLLGLTAASTTLALHCLVFIYFLGTGRFVKEVALAYGIPDDPLPKQTRQLKRSTFPASLFAAVVTIAAAVGGGGAQFHVWPWQVHLSLAIATLLVNGWAAVIEVRNVRTNLEVIDAVMREVDRIRAAAGLPSNAEALQQEQGTMPAPPPPR